MCSIVLFMSSIIALEARHNFRLRPSSALELGGVHCVYIDCAMLGSWVISKGFMVLL
jgi:hypothetical protein